MHVNIQPLIFILVVSGTNTSVPWHVGDQNDMIIQIIWTHMKKTNSYLISRVHRKLRKFSRICTAKLEMCISMLFLVLIFLDYFPTQLIETPRSIILEDGSFSCFTVLTKSGCLQRKLWFVWATNMWGIFWPGDNRVWCTGIPLFEHFNTPKQTQSLLML